MMENMLLCPHVRVLSVHPYVGPSCDLCLCIVDHDD